eukprot:EG_transcript_13425
MAGEGDWTKFVDVVSRPISVEQVREAVRQDAGGAIAVFDGITRDNFNGRRVLRLEYEAYGPMALREMDRICEEVFQRWAVLSVAMVHRIGVVPIGESSIVIAVCGAHRQEALEACHYAIDRLKATVPIWKREYYAGTPEAAADAPWKANAEGVHFAKGSGATPTSPGESVPYLIRWLMAALIAMTALLAGRVVWIASDLSFEDVDQRDWDWRQAFFILGLSTVLAPLCVELLAFLGAAVAMLALRKSLGAPEGCFRGAGAVARAVGWVGRHAALVPALAPLPLARWARHGAALPPPAGHHWGQHFVAVHVVIRSWISQACCSLLVLVFLQRYAYLLQCSQHPGPAATAMGTAAPHLQDAPLAAFHLIAALLGLSLTLSLLLGPITAFESPARPPSML